MKKNEITIGRNYLAKVTDKVVTVRIDAENRNGGWDATNLDTGKKVRIKSAQRLRGPAPRGELSAAAAARADRCDVNQADTPIHEAADTADADRVPLNEAMGTPAQPKAKKRSGLDSAYQLLKASGEPMRCKDLVDKMISGGLWHTAGKTPSATIYSAILREIQEKGEGSRFRKTDRGMFTAA